MTDTAPLLTNQFIDQHVTDSLHEKIIRELTTRKKGNVAGRKSSLTPEILRQFLFYVSIGEDYKNAAEYSLMGEGNRKDYQLRSNTFSEVSSLAKGNITLRSKIAVYRAIEGQLPKFYPIKNPANGETKYIELKEIPPNVAVAQWHLEKVNAYGDANKDDAPQLGAPRNEQEAELLLMLLNKHRDYVEAKSRQPK